MGIIFMYDILEIKLKKYNFIYQIIIVFIQT